MSLGQEIFAYLETLASCSEDRDKLTRRYLTPEHKRANELVRVWMEDAGMAARVDAAGNIVGRYEGIAPGLPALMLGSHLDTVVDAGRYDGMLGVVTPIACIKRLNARGERLDFAIEVVGFGDEEGLRFESTLLGSRAVAGTFDSEVLHNHDKDGISMHEALRQFGLDPNAIPKAARHAKEILGYVEVHIEQGPVLEAEDLPVGVVTSIASATRLSVTIIGRAGHAGTVPMGMRQDALMAAAEAVLAVEHRCAGDDDLVGTVGRIGALPGAANVIPGEVNFTIDVRSSRDDLRDAALADIRSAIESTCARRGLKVSFRLTHTSPSCACAPWLIDQIGRAIAAENIRVRHLASGAGHDAMAMTSIADVGMLFVRCRAGISHHPAESMTPQDAEVAARVLLRFIRNFKAPALAAHREGSS